MLVNLNDIDLRTVKDLRHKLVLVCLFTDRRVEAMELPEYIKSARPDGSVGGWWGDKIKTMVSGSRKEVDWGSRLYLLQRTKMNEVSEKSLQDDIIECLQIGIDAGIISNLEITAELGTDRANIAITADGMEDIR